MREIIEYHNETKPDFKAGDKVRFKAPAHESMIGKPAIILNVANAHERIARDKLARDAGWAEGQYYDVRLTAVKRIACDDGFGGHDNDLVPREFCVSADVMELRR